MNISFNIAQDTSGLYFFRLYGNNGEALVKSEKYTSKKGCILGLEATITSGKSKQNYHIVTNDRNQYLFSIVASNNQVLATSELYKSIDTLNESISKVLEGLNSIPPENSVIERIKASI